MQTCRTPEPGNVLAPDEWVTVRFTSNWDHFHGGFEMIHIVDGPIFVVSIEEDGYSAYILSQRYMGHAHVTPIVSTGPKCTDDQVFFMSIACFFVLIFMIACGFWIFM